MNLPYEPHTELERIAYVGQEVRIRPTANKRVEHKSVDQLQITSTFVNGFSGHTLDLLTFVSIFVVEANADLLLTLTTAVLIWHIPYYFHSIREILIVFAVLAYNDNPQLATLIAQLY